MRKAFQSRRILHLTGWCGFDLTVARVAPVQHGGFKVVVSIAFAPYLSIPLNIQDHLTRYRNPA